MRRPGHEPVQRAGHVVGQHQVGEGRGARGHQRGTRRDRAAHAPGGRAGGVRRDLRPRDVRERGGVPGGVGDDLGSEPEGGQPVVGDPGAELAVPDQRTVLGGHRGGLEHERVVRQPERLPRPVADGEDRHDGLGERGEQGGGVVLREPLRVHEHQPGALQCGLPRRHGEDVPEVGVRCDAGQVEGEAADAGRGQGRRGQRQPARAEGRADPDQGLARRDGRRQETVDVQPVHRHGQDERGREQRVGLVDADQVGQDPVRDPQLPAQPQRRGGRHLEQAVATRGCRGTQVGGSGAGQRRQRRELEGEADRGTRRRRPTAQQAERQREVRVEVGGGGDRQQLGVLLVQAEHVREPGQRVVVRGVRAPRARRAGPRGRRPAVVLRSASRPCRRSPATHTCFTSAARRSRMPCPPSMRRRDAVPRRRSSCRLSHIGHGLC